MMDPALYGGHAVHYSDHAAAVQYSAPAVHYGGHAQQAVHYSYAAAAPQVAGTHPGAWLESIRAGTGPEAAGESVVPPHYTSMGAAGESMAPSHYSTPRSNWPGRDPRLPAEQYQYSKEAEEEPLVVSLVVPDEAGPGTKLQYTAPDGQELRLSVPDGVPPGSLMTLFQDPVTKMWRCEAEPPEDDGEEPYEEQSGTMHIGGTYPAPSTAAIANYTAPAQQSPGPAMAFASPAGRLIPTGAPSTTVTTVTRQVVGHGHPKAVNLSYVPPPAATASGDRPSYTPPPPAVGAMASYTPPPVYGGGMASYTPPVVGAMAPQHASYTPPKQVAMAEQRPSYAPPPMMMQQQQHASYTPPPAQLGNMPSYTPPPGALYMHQGPSYTPPPMAMEQRPSYTPPSMLPNGFGHAVDPSMMATTAEVRPVAVSSTAMAGIVGIAGATHPAAGPSITTLPPNSQEHVLLPQQHAASSAMIPGYHPAHATAGVPAAAPAPFGREIGLDLPPIQLPPFPFIAPQIGIPNVNFGTSAPAPIVAHMHGYGAMGGSGLGNGGLPHLAGMPPPAGLPGMYAMQHGHGHGHAPPMQHGMPGTYQQAPAAAGFGGFNMPPAMPGLYPGGLQPGMAPQAVTC